MEATELEAAMNTDAAPKVSPEVLGLLWRAFCLRGVHEGLPLKARLSRRFKALMEEACLWVQQPNGDLAKKPDPRGGLQLPNLAQPFLPTPDEAEYLEECVKELREKRKQDGSPMVDSGAADHIQHIVDELLPSWKKRGEAEEGTKE